MFPNPSNGSFTVETKETVDVIIYSAMGQEVLNIQLNENTNNKIDLSSQAKGVYFLTYIANNERIIKKILIK